MHPCTNCPAVTNLRVTSLLIHGEITHGVLGRQCRAMVREHGEFIGGIVADELWRRNIAGADLRSLHSFVTQ